MDRIPIGGTPPDPDDGEHDNVVRLPSVQASDEVVGIPVGGSPEAADDGRGRRAGDELGRGGRG